MSVIRLFRFGGEITDILPRRALFLCSKIYFALEVLPAEVGYAYYHIWRRIEEHKV